MNGESSNRAASGSLDGSMHRWGAIFGAHSRKFSATRQPEVFRSGAGSEPSDEGERGILQKAWVAQAGSPLANHHKSMASG
ncbi:protein of unknown function [Pseudomonas mediterranea]